MFDTSLLEPSEPLAAEPAVSTQIKIGYARVSTGGQKLERQLDSLKAAGCRRISAEKQSGRDTDRPELASCLECMAAGDTLVVPSLDRLSRSLQDLITTVGELRGGRLDPPLTLCLDEAALICPVPLDSWTADMGGRGVSIIAAFQSRAQLIARWAITGAATILNNAGSIMVFGGTRDRDDLAYWSGLAGERDEPLVTRDGHGAERPVSRRRSQPVEAIALVKRALRSVRGRSSHVKGAYGIASDGAARHP